MSTRFHPLHEEDLQITHNLCLSVYLDGRCYAFAVALHRLTGWPIVALATSEHRYRHAAVRDPEGRLYDVRGKVPLEEFGKPFHARPPYDLHVVTLEDLRAVDPVKAPVADHEIERATKMAETLWPELVVSEGSRQAQVRRFLDELEALSRKHKIWIRAPYVTAKPCLSEEGGEEAGYDATPTMDGNTYVFDRTFNRERR